MKVIGVIPARYGSTRLKAKVLAKIQGKPMIQHVWERAKKSQLLDDLVIACDDRRTLEAAQEFGARAVMTSAKHPSGSDRVAEVVRSLDAEIVINIQGDEPLIQHKVIDQLAEVLLKDSSCVMATVIKGVDDLKELSNPNVVKVVVDKNRDALYFSRSLIPFKRNDEASGECQYFKHLGIYGYRKSFLMNFVKWPKSALEKTEQLEQLRVLEAGYKIKTVVTDIETISVDTKEDLQKVEALLSQGKRYG